MLGCNFVLSIASFICSLAILSVFSASIDFMNVYPDSCNYSVKLAPGNYSFTAQNNTALPLIYCGDYSEYTVSLVSEDDRPQGQICLSTSKDKPSITFACPTVRALFCPTFVLKNLTYPVHPQVGLHLCLTRGQVNVQIACL